MKLTELDVLKQYEYHMEELKAKKLSKEERIEYVVMLSASTIALLSKVSSFLSTSKSIDHVIKMMEECLFNLEYEANNDMIRVKTKKRVLKRYPSLFVSSRFLKRCLKTQASIFKNHMLLKEIYVNVYTYGMLYYFELTEKMSSNLHLFKEKKKTFYYNGKEFYKNNLKKGDSLIKNVFRTKLEIGKL